MPPFCTEHDMHHRYNGEHDDMRDAAAAAQKDAERRDRAEQIANNTAWKAWPGITREQAERVFAAMTAAALQALTEKENAQ